MSYLLRLEFTYDFVQALVASLVCHAASVNTMDMRRKFKRWRAELRDAKVEAASRPLSENT